jgi:hypothetical protein
MKQLSAILLVLFLMGGCDDVSLVDRVVLVNSTDYDVVVDVKGAEGTTWLGLGTAHRKTETAKDEVIDQGETWIFRFSYAGEDLGDERVSRADLVKNNWRYEIPERVGQTLQEKGYAPSIG